ncbi:MAG: diguanylate cyclase, partial [Perlucidibaca sp.]
AAAGQHRVHLVDLALLACVVFNDPQPALPTLTLAALLAGLASLRLSWRGLLLTCFLALLTATVAAGSRSLLSDTDPGAVAATATMVVLLLALVLAFRHHSRDLQLQVARTKAHDPATGLGNRWTLYAAAQLLWPLAHRQQMPVTLLYARIDIPGLRPGQSPDIAQADSVAAGFAGIARERLRGSDILVRYAPLEFAFMLLDCPGNQADAIAQQLQARFQHWSQEHGSAATMTIGATWLPTQPLALDLMLTSVDEAMQRARQYRAGTRGAVHVDPEQIRNRATLS